MILGWKANSWKLKNALTEKYRNQASSVIIVIMLRLERKWRINKVSNNIMPHQFMSINCKKCGENYCPVCHKLCPKCGELDVADDDTMVRRSQMRLHMQRGNRNKKF